MFAVALAALTFVSCSKDEAGENTGSKEMTTVAIHLQDGMQTPSRASGPSISNNTTISITSGKLYFTTNAGVITKSMNLVNGGGSTAENIDVTITTAQTIQQVPANSDKVYIVGNITGLPVAGNISTVLNGLRTINSQYDATGKGVANVTMYGTSNLDKTVPTNYTATVQVKPISARIEIAKFTAGGIVTQYRVDGIFLNNYYAKSKTSGVMSGTASPANDYVSNGTETDSQNPAIYIGNSTQYPTADAGITYDYNATGIGTFTSATKVYAPSSGSAWVYNLLAPTDGTQFPHIEIVMSNFNSNAGLLAKQYITVTGFADATTGQPIASFEAGKIYKIANFEFDETDLVVGPAIGRVTAQVTVSLAQWKEVNVNPIN